MQNETHQNPMDLPESTSQDVAELVINPLPVNLTAAREAKRLSTGDAAYALKVNPRVIVALEAGDWSALPGRAFAVGILRAYGRLLEISVDALVDTVPGASSIVKKVPASGAAPRAMAPTPSRRDGEATRQTHRMLKTGMLMMLIAVVLAYVVPGDFWQGTLERVQSLMGRVSGIPNQPPSAEANPSITPAATGETGVPSPAAASAEQQVQTSTSTLELKFAGPAWVEVRDYSGRIIYSQLNAAGSTQFITGAAPLDVMIGNAKQVQARWRDESIKLDKLSGDDVARQILR
jgi:cytoskeleton protein RodZ